MFERYTDQARRVIVLAQEEARMLGAREINDGHLLLGLIAEGGNLAAMALHDLDLERVREGVGPGEGDGTNGHMPFTPHAKKAMERAVRQAIQLGHNYIAPEHLLLGLLQDTPAPRRS